MVGRRWRRWPSEARVNRKAPDADNPFLAMQEQVSEMVTAWLKTLGRVRDQTVESDIPCGLWLALVAGLAGSDGWQRAAPPEARHVARSKGVRWRRRSTNSAPLWTAAANSKRRSGPWFTSPRGNASQTPAPSRYCGELSKAYPDITFAHYKAVVREEWAKLVLDEEAALEALPRLLPADAAQRSEMFEKIRAIAVAAGDIDPEANRRLCEMEALFNTKAWAAARERPARDRRHINEMERIP